MPAETDSAEKLIAELPSATQTLPLWCQMARLNPPAPNPKAVPHLWKYSTIKPYLLRAGKLVTDKQAERRVLMLVNPAMDAPYTTDTLYAGLQLVLPNETAPAHRHTAFAMRFIIEGNGGFTAVHGRRIKMNRGDVILTPTMNWHDHGKDGDGPMIWLDGLDLPNFRHFPVHFAEGFKEARYPAVDTDGVEADIVFKWDKMRESLQGGEWAYKRYLRRNGRELSKILGAQAERIGAGSSSPERRETTSAVYHVISGSGYSLIDGKRFEWSQSDTFCVPAWNKYQHFAGKEGQGDVFLFRFDDQPMLTALGFYRWEGIDVESLVSD